MQMIKKYHLSGYVELRNRAPFLFMLPFVNPRPSSRAGFLINYYGQSWRANKSNPEGFRLVLGITQETDSWGGLSNRSWGHFTSWWADLVLRTENLPFDREKWQEKSKSPERSWNSFKLIQICKMCDKANGVYSKAALIFNKFSYIHNLIIMI